MKKIIEFILNNVFEFVMVFVAILFVITLVLPMFLSIGIEMWSKVIGA